MKETNKPNDIFVATALAPKSDALTLLQNDININNTDLLSREEYKKTPFVKKQFTKDGIFDENAFEQTYNLAESKYWELDDSQLYQNLAKEVEYNSNSRYRPLHGKTRDLGYNPKTFKDNPLQQSIGIIGLNEKADPKLTPEEAAQGNRIWDPENKKWLDHTAENRNIFSKIFGDTLVYAQYDSNGIQKNPITGEVGEHKKGEFITDENGNYFTELLGNRELLDKQVVAVQDILTKEGSLANKFDFFDSDGYDKSLGGVAAKTLFAVAPYFIPGNVQKYYGAFTALVGLGSVLPTFYKSIESIFTGEDPSTFSKSATKIENWFRKYDSSVSRNGKENFFSVESIGNLLADTFGQLYQQRAAASLSKYLKKVPEIKTIGDLEKYKSLAEEQAKLAKALSLGYMGLISVSDVYNDALQSGYDRRTAGIASLASAAALFGIMNFNEGVNGLGTWFLDKTVGYNREVLRAPVSRTAKQMYKEFKNAVDQSVSDSAAGKKALADTFRTFKMKLADKTDDIFRLGAENVWKGMISEGVEEVSEEVVQDSIKGIIDTLSWLGFTGSQGSFGGWNNVFSKEGASRYLQTFLGGALGGGLFAVQNDIINPAMIRRFQDPNYKSPSQLSAEKDLMDIVIAGRSDEFINELRRYGKLFSDKRASTGYLDSDGTYHDMKAEGQKTQSDMIVSAAIDQVNALRSFVDEVFDHSDPSIRSLRTNADFSESFAEGFKNIVGGNDVKEYLFGKFKNALLEAKQARDSYNGASEKTEETPDSIKKSSLKKDYEDKLEAARNFFNGKSYIDGYQEALILKDPLLTSSISGLTFDNFYDIYIKNDTFTTEYKDLNETSADPTEMTKAKAKEIYETYQKAGTQTTDDALRTIPIYRKLLSDLQSLVSKDVSDFSEALHKEAIIKALNKSKISYEVYDNLIDSLEASDIFSEEDIENHSKETVEAQAEQRKSLLKRALRGEETQEDAEQISNDAWLKEKLSNLRSESLVNILKAHPKAFSLNQRLNIDYATKLIEQGALEIEEGWNEEQQKIVKELINKEIVSAHISEFNAENLQAIIDNVNLALSDNSNIFTKALNEKTASSGVTSSKLGKINLGKKANFAEIKDLQLKSIVDYLGDDTYISENLYNLILSNYATQSKRYIKILDALAKVKPEYSIYCEKVKTSLNDVNVFEDPESLIKAFTKNPYGLYTFFKNFGTEFSSEDFKKIDVLTGENIENSRDLLNDIEKLKTNIENFQRKYSEDQIITNPLQRACDKVYAMITGDSEGKSLLHWILNKGIGISNSNFDADEGIFSEEELRHIDDVISTLGIVLNAAHGMVYYDFEKDGQYGYNQAVYDYIKAYNRNKSELDNVKMMDKEDFEYLQATFADMIERLLTMKQISNELQISKKKEYVELRSKIMNASAIYYKHYLPKLELPDDEDNIVEEELLSEELKNEDVFEYTEDQLQDYILRCEQDIYNHFQNILNRKPENKEHRNRIIEAIHKQFSKGENYKKTAVLLKDAYNCSESGANVHAQFLMNKLVGMLSVSPKTIYTQIQKVYQENPSLYPRIDQITALEQMLYFLQDKGGNYNALNDLITADYNYDDKVFNRVTLSNAFVLLGAGGSGKTTLIATALKALKGEFPNVIPVAKNELKAQQLGDQMGLEGKSFSKFEDFAAISTAFSVAREKYLTEIAKHLKDSKYVPDLGEGNNITFDDENSNVAKCTWKYNLGGADKTLNFTIRWSNATGVGILSSNNVFSFDFNDTDLLDLKENDVIVIDEYTLLNQFDLGYISNECKKKGAKLILLGDLNQSTDSLTLEIEDGGEIKKETLECSPESYTATYANQLQGSWRMENSAQKDNAQSVLAVNKIISGSENLPLDNSLIHEDKYESEYRPKIRSSVKLIYTTEGAGSRKFMGTAITKDSAQIDKIVKTIGNASSVCVIVNDHNKDDEIKERFKDLGEVNVRTLEEVQGAEYDYIVSYELNKSESPVADYHKVYTIITRGRYGNLIIQRDDNDLFENTGIDRSRESDKIFETASDTTTEDAKNYVELLESILPSLKEEKKSVKSISTFPSPKPEKPQNKGDEEDGEENDKNTSTALSDAGFKAIGICQTWYYRPGLTTEQVSELRSFKKAKDFFEKYKSERENWEIYDFFLRPETDKSVTGEELIQNYKKFINELRAKIQQKDGILVITTDDRGSSDPLDKWNNKGEVGNARFCVKQTLLDSKGTTRDVYFTIGAVGYIDPTDPIGTKIRDVVIQAQGGNYVELEIENADKDSIKRIENYLKPIEGTEAFEKFKSGNKTKKSPIFYGTGNRVFVPKTLTGSEGEFNGKVPLETLKSLGYGFDTTNAYDPDFTETATEEIRKDNLQKFLNKYSRKEVADNDPRLNLANRKWILMTTPGYPFSVPVCLEYMGTFEELLNNENSYTKPKAKRGNSYLKSFVVRDIIKVLDLYAGDTKLIDEYNKVGKDSKKVEAFISSLRKSIGEICGKDVKDDPFFEDVRYTLTGNRSNKRGSNGRISQTNHGSGVTILSDDSLLNKLKEKLGEFYVFLPQVSLDLTKLNSSDSSKVFLSRVYEPANLYMDFSKIKIKSKTSLSPTGSVTTEDGGGGESTISGQIKEIMGKEDYKALIEEGVDLDNLTAEAIFSPEGATNKYNLWYILINKCTDAEGFIDSVQTWNRLVEELVSNKTIGEDNLCQFFVDLVAAMSNNDFERIDELIDDSNIIKKKNEIKGMFTNDIMEKLNNTSNGEDNKPNINKQC